MFTSCSFLLTAFATLSATSRSEFENNEASSVNLFWSSSVGAAANVVDIWIKMWWRVCGGSGVRSEEERREEERREERGEKKKERNR